MEMVRGAPGVDHRRRTHATRRWNPASGLAPILSRHRNNLTVASAAQGAVSGAQVRGPVWVGQAHPVARVAVAEPCNLLDNFFARNTEGLGVRGEMLAAAAPPRRGGDMSSPQFEALKMSYRATLKCRTER